MLLPLLLLGCAWKLGPPAVTYADDAAALPLVHPSTDARRWYIPLDAGEHGSWLLFVDTGYSYTTCDDDFVQALSAPIRGNKAVRGELGTVITRKAKLPPIEIGGHRLDDLVCLVRDLDATSSISDPQEVRIAGVLGIDALRRFRVELDPAMGEIRLLDPDSVEPIEKDVHTVKLRREYGIGTRVRLPVAIEGKRTRPILDTGASNTYIDGDRLGLEATFIDQGVRVRGTGPGGELVMDRAYYDVSDLTIAGHQAAPLTLTDRPRGAGAPGLLGLDVLERFTVELDFGSGLARFRPATGADAVPSWRTWSQEGSAPVRLVSPPAH